MKHLENRSQTWFKILTPEGRDLDNEMKKWFLPEGVKKGEWFTSGCRIGTWLVLNPKEFMQKTNRVFVVELDAEEPIIELPGIIWVRKVRLVREATNLDLKRFGIYRAFRQII
ncbi:MAG: hypothetical protein Q7W13_00705 [Bacteroidia bacterium]|nr:hypothetical protein [Bacteroidia bacterium]